MRMNSSFLSNCNRNIKKFDNHFYGCDFKMRKIGLLLGGFMLIVLLGCNQAVVNEEQPTHLSHHRMDFSMRTPINITIFDLECNNDEGDGERCELLNEAFELIFDLERRLTVNDVGGEVELINEMAGIEPVVVETDTFYLIDRAIYYSIYSDKLFNATIGPLTSLWNIHLEGARRPSDDEIIDILPLLDPTRVILDAEASTVFLEEVGMRLDLGAIAKGFMADEVADLFVRNGIGRASIVIGGEVLVIGDHPTGRPFNIGINSPFPSEHGRGIVGSLPAYNQAIVTSGTYNRYLIVEDTETIYHHIFDSRTGFPFDNDIVSITVVADTGLLGEVYTTIIFGMGLEAGMAYVEEHPEIEVMLITRDKMIHLSSGLRDVFELRMDDFEIYTQ